jgi:hypothetical protein
MPTYFSINDGFFNTSSVFAATLSAGDVTAGTVGNLLTTTFSYPTTLATSNGSTYCGIALQLFSGEWITNWYCRFNFKWI